MSFRTKLLLACLPLALAPLAFFGLRTRDAVTARIDAQYAERVTALADVIERELERESEAVAVRLERLAEAMAADNRLRLALRAGGAAEVGDRAYLLDYAGGAMPLAGLDLLRVQDETGRVLSSGHFRNEYDAVDPALPAALRRAGARGVLVTVPTATGSMLALSRADSVRVGTRTLTLVGGTAVDDRFLDRLAGGTGLEVGLRVPGGRVAAAASPQAASPRPTSPRAASPGSEAPSALARDVTLPFAGTDVDTVARFVVRASTGPLDALRGDMDRRLLLMIAAAAALALLLAVGVSAGLSRPLAELARKAGRIDLDRLDVRFASGRADEIGALSRVLDRMTYRLRTGAVRLREAERRATIGEIARQVNHDIRNGLIPIRNVVSHLAELARERPDALPDVFRERQGTLESSVAYLQSLAGNYARLSPSPDRRACDLNAVVEEVVGDVAANARIATDLAPRLPPVHADPVALRRIVENLVRNALESLEDEDARGRVTVSTRLDRDTEPASIRLVVADTGPGMSADTRARIFDDFYTTKPDGTGLGLSIVRRLVNDLGGHIDVETEPGAGTRFTIELPVGDGKAPAGGERGAWPAPRGTDARRTGRGAADREPGGEP